MTWRPMLGCLAAAGLLALNAAGSLAQTRAPHGAGGVLCSQYSKAARSSDIVWHQASNWLLGYVSGMNAALAAAGGPAKPVSLTNDQVLKSAREYCEANPGSTIADAAHVWYASLPKEAEAAPPPAPRENEIRLNLTAPKMKPLLDRH